MYSPHIAIFSILLLFGVGYNALVAEMEHRKIEGYTWAQVALGTLLTVAASAVLIGWQAAALVLACLFFSGLPMIVGAIWRHHRKIEAMIERLLELARHDEQQG